MRLAKLGTGAERYYLASVAAGGEDHRPAGLEPDGTWLGAGSAGLGLGGKVDAAQLEAVLGGSHPASGLRLNPAQSRIKVVGYDLVFAAPKSVSILFGIADPEASEQVQSAHESAVGDALEYLERTAVSARRRDSATRWSVPTAGVIAAGFVHRTSRLADPHLHTHVLVSNLVEGEDGRWTALDARGLYAYGTTAGYLYHARLRHELVRSTGVAFGPVTHGVANVVGVDPVVMEDFSQRRGQVVERFQAWGTGSPRAAHTAALATRPPKDSSRSIEELRNDWLGRADALGLTQSGVRALLNVPAASDQALDFEAITAALVERTGSFGERDLLRAVAQSLPNGSDVATIERISEAIVASASGGALLVEHGSEIDTWRARQARRVPSGIVEARWTTRRRVRAEEDLVREVRCSDRGSTGITHSEGLAVALQRRPELSVDQVGALRHLVGSESGIEIFWGQSGPAGTDVLEAAREVWQLAGLTVCGLAKGSSDGAALELSTGVVVVPSTGLVPAEAASSSNVILVAEAQSWGVGELRDLIRSAGRAKVVLVVDAGVRGPSSQVLRQLGSYPSPLALLAHEVEHRPAEPSVAPVRVARDPEQCVVVGLTAPALRRALVEDWWTVARTETPAVMVAKTRAEVDVLNAEARARMREAGKLGLAGEPVCLGKVELAVGDWVQLRWGHARLGLDPHARANVVGIEEHEGRRSDGVANRVICLRSDTGAEARVALDQLHPGQLVHGYAVTAHQARHLDREVSCLVLGGPEVLARARQARASPGRQALEPHELDRAQPERETPLSGLSRSRSAPALSHYVLDATLARHSALAMTLAEDRARCHLGRSDELLALAPPPSRRASGRELPAPMDRPPFSAEPPPATPSPAATPGSHELLDPARCPRPGRTRSLAELAPELEHLRSVLLAGLPPDPTRQLADLAEERAAMRLGQANAAALMPSYAQRWDVAASRVAERQVELEQAVARRQAWVMENAPALTRYGELTRAVAERQVALGRVAEVMRYTYVISTLGPAPQEAAERDAWREAAGAIEAFRERWEVTDANRALGHDHPVELARCRERSEVERTVLDTQSRLRLDRVLERERGVVRERDMGRSLRA